MSVASSIKITTSRTEAYRRGKGNVGRRFQCAVMMRVSDYTAGYRINKSPNMRSTNDGYS
jgi:hypothetical protein